MADIGFFELVMVGLVALLVIGPERLPTVARTAGKWIGRGRRVLQSVKADIERELRAEELKRILKEQAESTPVHEIIEQGRSSLEKVKQETGAVLDKATTVSVSEEGKEADSGKTDHTP